jgi:rare lipoprotein A
MRLISCVVGITFAALTLSSACANGVTPSRPATKAGEQTEQPKSPPKFSQTGRASYYHNSLRGLRTSSGERYDPNVMTAAHRRLKLGTYVRVTRLRNKRSVIVKVNDRLPRHGRAIIDLSTVAARKLGMYRAGIAKVRIETLTKAEVAELLATQE